MIQQQHLEPYPTPEVMGTKKITMTGLSVDVSRAMQQYAQGTLESRIQSYYEMSGMSVPDFHMMSKIERLESLNEYKKQVKESTVELEGFAAARAKRQEEVKVTNAVNKKVDEKLKERSTGDGKTKDG